MSKLLNTRAAHQAQKWTDKLRRAGHEVIEFPVTKIVDRVTPQTIKVIKSLSARDWLVFTSGNAPFVLTKYVNELGDTIKNIKIAAIGIATAEVIRSVGLPVSLISEVETADGLANQLGKVIESNSRVVHLCGIGSKVLPNINVETHAIYQSVLPDISREEVLAFFTKHMITSFDGILLFSGLSCKRFLALTQCLGEMAFRKTAANTFGQSAYEVATQSKRFGIVNRVQNSEL